MAERKQDNILSDLKTPPHAFEAEQSVIGGLILDSSAWDQIAETLIDNDFYNRPHRLIFRAISDLVGRNLPVDLVTLQEKLASLEQLEEVGGFAYIVELAKNTPSAANIKAYADIVRERALIREMITAANEIIEAGYEPQGRSAGDLLDDAERRVFNIVENRVQQGEGPQALRDVLTKTLDRIETLFNHPHDGITGISTGYTDLDQKTAGLQPADLVVLAARPSMGKTTFGMNLCEHAAMTQDKPVLIFSLEMPAEQIIMRMLASIGRIDQTRIRTGQLAEDDWAKISSTMALLLDKGKLFIDDSPGLTPNELRARARRIAREHGGISMIMVDYLQLMRVPNLSENRTLEISEISRSLKAIAKELQCPVVALSQLNRGLEQRSDKRPINSDLRESGAIEQDADLILFIYRDEVYHDDSPDKGTAEIIIGKQRNGPIGRLRLTFQGQYSRFDNYAGTGYDDEY